MESVEFLDPTDIRITSKNITVDSLCERITERKLSLSQIFRDKPCVWKSDLQSRLIESILIRVPLPAIYIDYTDDCWRIIDGVQRLITFKRFVIDKKLRLSGLEFLEECIGKTYDELHRGLQRRILETEIPVFLIEKGTPAKVIFSLFKRIRVIV